MYRYLSRQAIVPLFYPATIPMKNSIIHAVLLLLFIGCKMDDKITFEQVTLENKQCVDCPEVFISVPKVVENTRLASTINSALNEEIITLLLFDEEKDTTTVEAAMTSFKHGYQKLKERYTDEATPWEAKIDGRVTFEDEYRLTIALDSYLFTGGAHGYNVKRFLNFDKKKGVALENWELFNNEEDFRLFAEEKFRAKENIPLDKPINYTGFMFDEDSFYLPENIGFTEEGIKLLYNQYEVSSFADETVELTLPFEEVDRFLADNSKS